MQREREDKLSLLQLLGDPPLQDLPRFCLMSSLLGVSHTCVSECQHDSSSPGRELGSADSQPAASQTIQSPSKPCRIETPSLDTSLESKDLRCLTYSSTPYRKVSSPRNLVLDPDTDGDWSISMATPTCQRVPVESTPAMSTTDEEMSGEGSTLLQNSEKIEQHIEEHSQVPPRPPGKPVARTLFAPKDSLRSHCSSQPPAVQRHPSSIAIKGRFEHCLFSPICASPLLSCQQKPQPGNQETEGNPDMSVSLISSHTVLDTPTSARRRVDRESVGLDKAFCDEGGPQVSCSQELFGSPEVFEADKEEVDSEPVPAVISSIPDSPGPPTEHTDSPPPPKPDIDGDQSSHAPHRDEDRGSGDALPMDVPGKPTEPSSSHLKAVGQTAQPMCVESEPQEAEAAGSSIDDPSINQQQCLSQSASVPSLLTEMDAPADTPLPNSCSEPSVKRRRVATNMFLYPGSKQLTNRRHQSRKIHRDLSEVKEVECSVMESPGLPRSSGLRKHRKRSTSGFVAPPGKRPHLGSEAEVGVPQLHNDKGGASVGKRADSVAAVSGAEVTLSNIKTALGSEGSAGDVTAASQSVCVDPQTVSYTAQHSAESAKNSAACSSSILPSSTDITPSTSNKPQASAEHRVQPVQSTADRTVHAPIRPRGLGSRAPGLRRSSVRRESISVECGVNHQPSFQETEPAANQERGVHGLSSPLSAPPPSPPPATSRPLSAATVFPISVGFRTASGLGIQVSTRGMERAQQLMADEMKGKEQSSSEKKVPNRRPLVSSGMPAPGLTSNFTPSIGFQTASGHSVSISEKGMERARQFLCEELMEGKEQSRSEKEVPSKRPLVSPAPGLPSTFTSSTGLPAPGLTPTFTSSVGFQTASGHSVSISEKGMERARQLLGGELDEKQESGNAKLPASPQTLPERGSTSPVVPQTDQGTLPITPLPSKPQVQPTSQCAHIERKVRGATFKTPSSGPTHPAAWSTGGVRARGLRRGKQFKAPRLASSVSKEEERAKTARLLRSMRQAGAGVDSAAPDRGGNGTESWTASVHVESRFSTAGGKKLSMSASSFRHAQKLMAEEGETRAAILETPTAPSLEGPVPFPPPFSCGFQSASGKRLQVSAKAMDRAQSLFSGISDGDTPTTAPPAAPPVTASTAEHAGMPEMTQHSQSSFTAEDLDREDIDNLSAFTQVQFLPRDQEDSVTGVDSRKGRCGDDVTDSDGVCGHPTPVVCVGGVSGKGELGEEEEEVVEEEDDHSAYFSTQVVKQFLDFSNEEEDGGKSMNGSKVTSTQEEEGMPHVRSQPQSDALLTTDINSSDGGLPDSPTLPPDCPALSEPPPVASGPNDTLTQVTPRGKEEGEEEGKEEGEEEGEGSTPTPVEEQGKSGAAEGICLSFSLQPNTTSIIDELFDSISTDCDPPEDGAAAVVEESSLTNSTDPAQTVSSAQDVSTATVACRELCEMSASMVENLVAMDVSLVSRTGEGRAAGDGSMERCSSEQEGEFVHHDNAEEDGGEGKEECEEISKTRNGREGYRDMEAGTQAGQESSPSHGSTHQLDMACPQEVEATSECTPVSERENCGQLLPARGEEEESTTVRSAPFPGLATASGRPVKLSDSALSAARAVLHLVAPDPVSLPAQDTSPGVSTSMEDTLPSLVADVRSEVVGLQTASGKAVTVSEGALRAAKSALDSSTLPPLAPPQPSPPPPSYPGLQTASHKPVEVSRQALLQARAVLDREPPSVLPGAPPTSYPGLQTASGRRVEVSEAALAAVRESTTAGPGSSLSGSLSQPHVSGRRLPGLQTASGQRVEVSQSALEAARLAIGSGGRDDMVQPVAPGVWTAGESEVDVSEVAHSSLTRDTRDISDVSTRERASPVTPTSREASAAVPVACWESSAPSTTSSAGTAEVPHVRPSFRPAAPSTPGLTSQTATPGVRYKPVFKRNHQTHSSLPPSHLPKSLTVPLHSSQHTPSAPTDRRTGGLLSSMEGTLLDRAPSATSRQLLTALQLYPAQDGTYISTPVHRFPPCGVRQGKRRTSDRGIAGSVSPGVMPRSVSPYSSLSPGPVTTPTVITSVSQPPCSVEREVEEKEAEEEEGEEEEEEEEEGVGKREDVKLDGEEAVMERNGRDQKEESFHEEMRGQHTEAQESGSNPPMTDQQSELCGTYAATLPSTDCPVTDTPQTELRGRAVGEREEEGDRGGQREDEERIGEKEEEEKEEKEEEEREEEEEEEGEEEEGKKEREEEREEEGVGEEKTVDERSGMCQEEEVETSNSTEAVSIPYQGTEEHVVIATDHLNDSLEEEEEGEEEEVEEGEGNNRSAVVQRRKGLGPARAPKCFQKCGRPSSGQKRDNWSLKGGRKAVSSHAGSLLATRLELCDRRVPLAEMADQRPPGRHSERELLDLGLHPPTLKVSSRNAGEFQFPGHLFFSSAVLKGAAVCVGDGARLTLREGQAGPRELWEAFSRSPGVDSKLISFDWFCNHYRWVVWKLAAMEVSFPHQCAGRCLTPDWVMLQMRYRYDREIERAERSAVHKMCERDDLSGRRVALCVCAVLSDKGRASITERGEGEGGGGDTTPTPPTVKLTDGWYSLPAVLDAPLRHMVKTGRITVGTKLLIHSAELVGSGDPCHPLEAPPTLCLKLAANSTRRARWFTKLGYQPSPHPFPVPLVSLYPDGGVVGCTEAVIARVYPLIYMEKVEEGRNIFRSHRAEERAARAHQEKRQRKIEAISMRVQQEFEENIAKQETRVLWRRSRRLNTLQVKQLQDGEEIYNALLNSPDPQALQDILSRTQLALLESYRQSLHSSRQAELQREVEEMVRAAEEAGHLPQHRVTVPLLRVRLVPVGPSPASFDCLLSVWRPREDVRSVLVEGGGVRLWHVNTTPNKFGPTHRLKLSASRATRFEAVAMEGAALATYHPRTCVSIGSLGREGAAAYGEFDTVGVVVCVMSAQVPVQGGSTQQVDTVHLADSSGNMLAVKVWEGLEHHALTGLLSPSALVAATSLTFKGHHTTTGVVMASAGDCSNFSQAPHEAHLRQGLQELRETLPRDLTQYLHDLEEEIVLLSAV